LRDVAAIGAARSSVATWPTDPALGDGETGRFRLVLVADGATPLRATRDFRDAGPGAEVTDDRGTDCDCVLFGFGLGARGALTS